jgi:hypothetical protein
MGPPGAGVAERVEGRLTSVSAGAAWQRREAFAIREPV